MHKSVLLLFLSMLLTTITYSQTKVGVFGGINMTKLNGDIEANSEYTSKLGGNFGVFIDLKLKKNIYLSIQPSYSQEGTKITHLLNGQFEPIDSITVKLDYFSLPILFKATNSNERFYAIGGIETSILVNSSKTFKGEEATAINKSINSWNFSMNFGLGFRIPIGFSTLFIEARYTQGITNITEDIIVNDFLPRVKSSSIKFLTGIEIPLGTTKK